MYKIKMSGDPVLGEGPLPGLQRADISLYPYMAKRNRDSSLSPSYNWADPIHEGFALTT